MLLRSSLLFICLLFLPLQVQAHKIHIFAWVSGNTVTVESQFSANRPLLNGKVTVKDNNSDTVLLQGTGDEKGIFTFPVPAMAKETAMDLLIVVSGSEGHQSTWLIPADEYLAGNQESHPAAPVPKTEIGNTELKQMIQELLEQELAPIRRSLAKAEDKPPGFRDIMGGIGYLLGLAGLIAWLRNRPKKSGENHD